MRDRAVPFEETVENKEMSEEEKRELSRKARKLDEIFEAQKEAERRIEARN